MADRQETRGGEPKKDRLVKKSARSYYAEIAPQPLTAQSALVERLIELAFGDLGARHLEVRVAANTTECCPC